MVLLKYLTNIIDKRTPFQKAIDWVKNNRVAHSGIRVHHKTNAVTPEVTGYLITSMWNAGEKDFAFELAQWEASVQKPDGSFGAPDDKPYTFDTAQVVRGFLSASDVHPEFKENIIKACNYICSQIDEKGEVHTSDYTNWKTPDGHQYSVYCNLYNIKPLWQAGEKFNKPEYIQAAKRALNYYKQKADLVEFKTNMGTFSHIFGYMMEALAELNEMELLRRGLNNAKQCLKPDGCLSAHPGVQWVCPSGSAQLGIAWYHAGEKDIAEKILKYLENNQTANGGFYGSTGPGALYFPKKEICWAVKYFIDLHLLLRGQNG